MVTLLTLNRILLPSLCDFEGKTAVESTVEEVNSTVPDVSDISGNQTAHVHMIAGIEQSEYMCRLDNVDEHHKGMAAFIRNYTRQFE